MQKEPSKIAILISNYFEASSFEEPLKTLANIGCIDVISSESGKIKTWDKTMKEYYELSLYKSDIRTLNAMEYNTIIVHEKLLNGITEILNNEVVAFINKFMGRKKPIVAVCQKQWTIIASTKPESTRFDCPSLSATTFKISA